MLKIVSGEALSIYEILKRTGGSLSNHDQVTKTEDIKKSNVSV